MVKLNGGYNMLDLTADDVYVQAKNIVDVQNKKPTFIFDGTNTTAIQTIVLNNDNTITINGELTIATDGTLTPSDYKIQTPHLYRHNIHMESNGNNGEYFACIIYDTKPILTLDDLLGYNGKFIGVLCDSSVEHVVEGMELDDDNSLIEFYEIYNNESISIQDTWEVENISFDDAVVQLF